MRQITIGHLLEILGTHEPPCISLYQPTHRHHPDNQQDPIRFRNLVREIEASLRQKYPGREIRGVLEKFRALGDDADFWKHTLDGLAVLATLDSFRVFQLQRKVPEIVIVADSFHAKPLMRFLQSAGRYQVLCLSRSQAKLYEGNRDGLDDVELSEGVPRSDSEVLGEAPNEPNRTVAARSAGGGGAATIFQGHGSRKETVDSDAEKFFRAVDRAILEHHSRPSGLPLLVVALPEHIDLIRRVSHNPFLMSDAVAIDAWSLSPDRLREQAWQKVQPVYLERLAKLSSDFHEARSKHLGSADLTDVAQAVTAGRVGLLMVEADRKVAGRFDPATGRVQFGKLADPDIDDLLDDLAEAVLKRGGDVVVVPRDRMPTDTGAAAIYRF
jgi:hypothetical protein